MKYSYRILDSADDELLYSALWYEDKREGLGEEIILSFEASLNSILSNPFMYQVRHRDFRIANIYRFPFQIIYFVENLVVTVVSFHHCKKHQKTWKKK